MKTSLWLTKEDNELLTFLAKRTGLKKSTIIRLALRDFYQKALEDEELPKEVRRELLIREAQEVKRAIKRLRWLRHERRSVEFWLKVIEMAKKGDDLPPFYREKAEFLRDILGDVERLERRLKAILEEVERLEGA